MMIENRVYRDASDRLVLGLEDVPSLKYRFLRWKICKKFSLKKNSSYTKGLSEKFQTFVSEDGSVSIDWDNWSGFTVTALDKDSEHLVLKIKDYLSTT